MPKFNPDQFDYEKISDEEDVACYQKIIIKKDVVFTDLIELIYWKKANIWMMIIKSENLKRLSPEFRSLETEMICLFMGTIKREYDFRFLMKKIVKDPKVIAQMGC